MLYCKLRCNIISLATLAQWHRECKEVWKQEVTSFGRTASNFEKERLRVLTGPICPQISPKWKIISAKTARNLPKFANVALHGKTSQFSGGYKYNLVPCEGLHAKVPYCGSGIGSNEQGEYCRAVLERFCWIAKNRNINHLLYFYFLLGLYKHLPWPTASHKGSQLRTWSNLG